jgi:hypothetical protein
MPVSTHIFSAELSKPELVGFGRRVRGTLRVPAGHRRPGIQFVFATERLLYAVHSQSIWWRLLQIAR